MLTARGGFTLVEILVGLGIALILAAAFLPSLIGGLDRTRVDESAESLESIVEAVGSMYTDMARYPGRLSHLTTPVTGVDAGLCGVAYGATATAWAGPYLDRGVSTAGLPLPIGTARDLVSYTATPPLLRVHIDSVSHGDVRALNRKVDADADSLGGAVRWGPVSGSGLVELTYARPVKSC